MISIPYRLEITDGTTTIDLAHGDDTFYLEAWSPAAPGYKSDGIYQDSPLVSGRNLIHRAFNNIVDTFAIQQASSSPDNNIYYRQELRRLLEKAADYHTTEWQNTPVYLVAQGPKETSIRYSLVMAGNVPSTQNPYGDQWQYTFFGKAKANDAFNLTIEHGFWLSEPPGSGTAVCLTNGSVFNTRVYGPSEGAFQTAPTIFFYDDSLASYSANLAESALPTVLMPSGSTAGDILYIGAATPFDALAFTLSSGQNGTADTRWSYWSGAAWVTLDPADFIQDKTGTAGSPGAFSLQKTGVIGWNQIAEWRETNINGVNAYWIRMRLSGVPITANITASSRVSVSPVTGCQTYDPFVSNHDKTANLTDVYYYDASLTSFGSNLMNAILPFDWRTTNYQINDIIYFGIDSSVTGSGPFSNLIFNLDDGFSATAYVGAWQYWNGATWTALTVVDNTKGAKGPLEVEGENGVYWTPPTGWATTAVNGVTGWWVRLVFTTATSLVLPQQVQRHVYTVSWSFLEIPDGSIGGDIRAIIRTKIYGQNSIFVARPNRILCGERSVSRGADFRQFINLGNVQNPSGVTVEGFGGAAITTAADNLTATGLARKIGAGGGSVSSYTHVNFDDTIADQYIGEYRLFLRAFTDDTTGYTAVARLYDGTFLYDEVDGLIYESDPAIITDTGGYQFFDLGTIKLSDLTGGFSLAFYITATGVSDDLFLSDCELLPTDEFVFDSEIKATSLFNIYYLQVDGLSKRPLATLNKVADDLTVSGCRLSATSVPSVQSNRQTRLWFHVDYLLDNGAQYMCVRPSVEANQRYLSMRGSR